MGSLAREAWKAPGPCPGKYHEYFGAFPSSWCSLGFQRLYRISERHVRSEVKRDGDRRELPGRATESDVFDDLNLVNAASGTSAPAASETKRPSAFQGAAKKGGANSITT